jgi:hypothetical protein
LNPPISTVNDLARIWRFLQVPGQESVTFHSIANSQICQELLKMYGNLLNHDAKHPNNPLSIQKKQVQELFKRDSEKKKWNSIYRSGTIFRMKGNTIHASPTSDKRNCRVIFFYAASPTPITSLYEPDNQWNQVTCHASLCILSRTEQE